ncbi:MAG: M23 family metallopeptidase [Deltaproteobacteria bacterium]|nr:M23 family metallopeptidase [Deltaproteobacteria bacterium]
MVRNKKTLFIFLFLLLFVSACATTPKSGGVYHRVKKGETLWRISQAYNCDPGELARINHLSGNYLETGSVLFIPDATKTISIKPAPHPAPETPPAPKPPSAPEITPAPAPEIDKTIKKEPAQVVKKEPKEDIHKDKPPAPKEVPPKSVAPIKKSQRPYFIWPVEGTVFSKFGIYKGMRHNGIKIQGKEGMPVLASADGTVIHSAPIKYYGETIIIKHNDLYSTVYSHLKERIRQTGHIVKEGEQIGFLGIEEKSGKPLLHFEIRYKNRVKNPLSYLPKKK